MTIYPFQSLTAYIINGLNLQSKHIDDCVTTNKKITKENTGGTLISDNIDFRSKTLTTEKRQHIMIKGSTHQENIIIIFAANIRAPSI